MIVGGQTEKDLSRSGDSSTVVVEQKPSAKTVGKLRRLRRNRRFLGLTYWAVWILAGLVFLLVVAGAMAGLASG